MSNAMSHKTFPLRVLLLMSLFTAISIVCGKYLAFNINEMLRFSFENLPILFAGILLGPLCGAVVGITADLVGCLLVGYAINPVVTLGAACIGLYSGLFFKLFHAFPTAPRVLFTVLLSHLIGSVLIKTAGLAAFYSVPYFVLLLWRTLNYVLVGTAEGLLLLFLVKNKTVSTVSQRFLSRARKER